MNLQENIDKIHQMMGVITEDRMGQLINNMIDSMGIESAFKVVGDYDLMEKYFTDKDKIRYIKDQFHQINDGNYFNLEQISQKPIQIKEENGIVEQIEGLHKSNVTIIKYNRNSGGINKYYPKYEDLSSDTIDKLFRMMIGQYI